jgi:tryptophan-rich sensory protein
MKIKSISKLLISIVISQLAGLVGTFFTFSAIPTWYITLNKPTFNPPNYIFGPVWTILYTLIGISLYKIWIKKGSLKLFWIHLFLNAIWSPIFFGAKNLGIAFVVIILMWVSLIFLIKNFYKIDKYASYLLTPYLLWISFASFLNFSILILNP